MVASHWATACGTTAKVGQPLAPCPCGTFHPAPYGLGVSKGPSTHGDALVGEVLGVLVREVLGVLVGEALGERYWVC